MTNDGIFVLSDPETLVEAKRAAFVTEDDFQTLLAKFPALIPGSQIDAASPRRWIFIAREVAIPAEEGGAGRWAIDHLFLDQDGIPTLIEVKRATDTRLRREVVGQILDYAAHATEYWPIASIRAGFERTCTQQGAAADERLGSLLGVGADIEAFWTVVQTNLKEGRIRMLIVADEIPIELRKVVAFLNAQMTPAEFLAVEIQQYAAETLKTLVPMVYGQVTSGVGGQKGRPQTRQWDENSFLAEIREKISDAAAETAAALIRWSESHLQAIFGKGATVGYYSTFLTLAGGKRIFPFGINTRGKIEIYLGASAKEIFADPGVRLEWITHLNEIAGVAIGDNRINGLPNLDLADLSSPERREAFFRANLWVIEKARSAAPILNKA